MGLLPLLPTIAALALLVSACGAHEICGAEELQNALLSSSSGDVVELGACEIEGNFIVPSGVAVRGRGTNRTKVIGSRRTPTFTLTMGDETSVLTDLTVVASSVGGVRVDTAASLEDLSIEVPGEAFGVSCVGAPSVSLTRVSLLGSVTPENWSERVAAAWDRLDQGVDVGVAANRCAEVAIAQLTVERLVLAGFFRDSDTTWTGGRMEHNFRGVFVEGGAFRADDLHVDEYVQGDNPDLTGTAIVSVARADAVITQLTTTGDSPYPAVALFEASAQIANVSLVGGGVHVSESAGVLLEGSRVDRPGTFGIRIRRSSDVVVSETRVTDVQPGAVVNGDEVPVSVGDGVLVAHSTEVLIQNVEASNSSRVGVSVEACEDEPAGLPTFTNVEVSSSGTQRGAVAALLSAGGVWRNAPPGWDDGIFREGSALRNDMTDELLRPTEPSVCPP